MADKPSSKVVIVDENDNIIAYKNREAVRQEDIYRVSALWITNSRGEILLARRHRTKSHHPRKWGPAVAGTVEQGESYQDNIIKEAEEELGLQQVRLATGPKVKLDDETYHIFIQWYTLKIDKEIDQFTIQEDEVEEIKWFTAEELQTQLRKHPEEFLPAMKTFVALFVPLI